MIVYELNEVPKKIFDFYADAFPKSAFAFLRTSSSLFETFTADVGHLSPWITWPTMHRGVGNQDHTISDLGQDLIKINSEFPPIYNILANKGVKVGVFGSLQSYPIPDNLDNFEFYVPDTFAAGSECYPENLSAFQGFNLSMVKSNGRNVSKNIALRDASGFLRNSRKMGLEFATYGNLLFQLFSEKFNQDRLVRRRSSQAEIAFDIFFKQLRKYSPDVSFFFTNHVASSMHRYWPSIFPEDYPEGKFDDAWCRKWQNEIPHAIKVTNTQLMRLIHYCKKTSSELVICSSMGQHAVQNVEPINKQVLINNVSKLLSYLGFSTDEWEPRLAMAPRVVVKPKCTDFLERLQVLNKISINDKRISYFVTSTLDVRFDIELVNQDTLTVMHDNRVVDPTIMGLENTDLQDAAGSYAYHIPQGILLHYDPKKSLMNEANKNWSQVSVLSFAPSLVSKFDIDTIGYMDNRDVLFN